MTPSSRVALLLTGLLTATVNARAAEPALPPPPAELGGERLGRLVYKTPAGWQKQEADGRVVLTPPGASPQQCSIELLPGGPVVRTFAEDVAARIVDASRGRKVVGPGKISRGRGAGAEIIQRPMVVEASDGTRTWLLVWAADADGYVQHASFTADSEQRFQQHWKEASAFLAALRFHTRQVTEAGAGATSRPVVGGATSRPAEGNVPLALYVANLRVGPAPAPGNAAAPAAPPPKVQPEHVALFAGGMAIQTAALPGEGLVSVDLAAFRRSRPNDVGAYTLDKSTLTLMLPRGRATFTVKPDRLVRNEEPKVEYLAMPRTAGAKLQGAYRIEGADPKGPFMSFDPDGRFREQGRLRIRPNVATPATGGAPAQNLNDLPGGVGRYELLDYEIRLHYDDGRLERMSFYIPPGSAQNRGVLMVNGWRLMLQG